MVGFSKKQLALAGSIGSLAVANGAKLKNPGAAPRRLNEVTCNADNMRCRIPDAWDHFDYYVPAAIDGVTGNLVGGWDTSGANPCNIIADGTQGTISPALPAGMTAPGVPGYFDINWEACGATRTYDTVGGTFTDKIILKTLEQTRQELKTKTVAEFQANSDQFNNAATLGSADVEFANTSPTVGGGVTVTYPPEIHCSCTSNAEASDQTGSGELLLEITAPGSTTELESTQVDYTGTGNPAAELKIFSDTGYSANIADEATPFTFPDSVYRFYVQMETSFTGERITISDCDVTDDAAQFTNLDNGLTTSGLVSVIDNFCPFDNSGAQPFDVTFENGPTSNIHRVNFKKFRITGANALFMRCTIAICDDSNANCGTCGGRRLGQLPTPIRKETVVWNMQSGKRMLQNDVEIPSESTSTPMRILFLDEAPADTTDNGSQAVESSVVVFNHLYANLILPAVTPSWVMANKEQIAESVREGNLGCAEDDCKVEVIGALLESSRRSLLAAGSKQGRKSSRKLQETPSLMTQVSIRIDLLETKTYEGKKTEEEKQQLRDTLSATLQTLPNASNVATSAVISPLRRAFATQLAQELAAASKTALTESEKAEIELFMGYNVPTEQTTPAPTQIGTNTDGETDEEGAAVTDNVNGTTTSTKKSSDSNVVIIALISGVAILLSVALGLSMYFFCSRSGRSTTGSSTSVAKVQNFTKDDIVELDDAVVPAPLNNKQTLNFNNNAEQDKAERMEEFKTFATALIPGIVEATNKSASDNTSDKASTKGSSAGAAAEQTSVISDSSNARKQEQEREQARLEEEKKRLAEQQREMEEESRRMEERMMRDRMEREQAANLRQLAVQTEQAKLEAQQIKAQAEVALIKAEAQQMKANAQEELARVHQMQVVPAAAPQRFHHVEMTPVHHQQQRAPAIQRQLSASSSSSGSSSDNDSVIDARINARLAETERRMASERRY